MAEPTNPGQPSDSSTERGSPVNIETSGNVTVTRKDVATGDVKDIQADLLKALCDCIDKQTDTLKNVLENTKKEVVDAVKAGGTGGAGDPETFKSMERSLKGILSKNTGSGGGGEGGGGGGSEGGQSHAGAKIAEEVYDEAREAAAIFKKTSLPAFKRFGKLFNKGVMSQFENNMLSVNQKVISFGQSLTDIQGATRKTMGVIDEMFKSGQGGMIDVTALLTDLGAGLARNRDALSATLPVVQEFADKQRMLIGTLGSNLEDVARSFKENREAAKEAFGNDFLERIPFDELNAIQTTMLEQQRRAGVKATDAEILTSQRSRNQMQLLKDISFATGKTVEEVIKLQEEEGMTLEELRYNNLITEAQKKTMLDQATFFKGQGLEGISELMQQIAEEGGTTMFKNVEGAALMMGQGNNDALINEMYKLTQSAEGRTPEGLQRMIELAEQIEGLDMGVEGGSALRKDSGGMAEKFGMMSINATRAFTAMEEAGITVASIRAEQIKTEGNAGGSAQGLFNTIKETLINNLGGGGDLAIAIALNTGALIINSAALMKGALGGMMGGAGKLLKKIPGAGKLMSMLGIGGMSAAALNPATAGAAKGADQILKGTKLTSSLGATDGVASKAAGKGTAKFAGKAGAKSLLKKIPIIGLLAGLGFAAGRLMDGDFLGAGMEVASGAASLVPGIGTAASVALDAGLIARDMNMSEEGVGVPPVSDTKGIAGRGRGASVSPAGVASSPPQTSVNANTAYGQLAAQTMHLAALVQLTTQGNNTRLDMLDTIGHSGAQTGKPTFWGAVTNTNPPEAYTPLLDSGRTSLRQG